ncbi:MAG: flagellar hook-associated protein FlgL [bacterium]
MRVTQVIINQGLMRNISQSLTRLQLCQAQMATGKKILKPSDDPVGVAKSIRARAILSDYLQFQKNIQDGLGWLENSEAAINGISEAIIELKEIAVAGASDSKSEEQRSVLANQVEEIIDRIVTLLNTNYAGRFLFSGTYTTDPPCSTSFEVAGEEVVFDGDGRAYLDNALVIEGSLVLVGPSGEVYTEGVDYEIDYDLGIITRLEGGSMDPGDVFTANYQTRTVAGVSCDVDTAGKIEREIARGVYQQINIGAEEIAFSKVEIFDVMVRLKTALLRNNGSEVSGLIDDIDSSLEHVADQLGQIGCWRRIFDVADIKLNSEIVNFQSLISNIQDADLATLAVKYSTERMAYESALAAASKMLSLSLVNFLR